MKADIEFYLGMNWGLEAEKVAVPRLRCVQGPRNIFGRKDRTPPVFFDKMFTTEMWEHIVTETNRYESERTSAFTKESQVSMEEIKAFIGMILWMGVLKAPSLDCYWSDSKLYRVEAFQRIMTRDRFMDILHHLHLADNDDETVTDDKLAKFRPFLILLNNSCRAAWTLTFKFSIDEALVAFQGRLVFKQYLPDKPEKWGIKVFKKCDSNGFMYQCDIYTGASEDAEEDESTVDRVVQLLTSDVQNEHPYHLFVDNFYASIPLALKLLKHKIYITGTLRENRKYIPKVLKNYKLKNRGDCAWIAGKDGIILIKLLDTKIVYFISTAHTGCQPVVVQRKDGAGGLVNRIILKITADYNENMGTVDQHSQFNVYYSYDRRCSKWW